MTRSTRFRLALLAFVPALMCAVSCGKKGPPLAPLLRVPARGDEVRLRRLGNDVTVGFRIPDKNTDGSSPANLEKMELRALTGDVVDEIGRPLDSAAFVKYSTLVAQVEVEPPPPPDEDEAEPSDGKQAAPPKPPKPPDPRPAQGETIVIVETLTDAARTPATVKTMRKPPKPPPPIEPTPPIAQPLISPPITRLARTYVVVGVNKKGQAGTPSARLAVPLDDPPPPPGTPTVKYTATAMVVEWAASAGALVLPAPAVAEQSPLPARPLGIARAPHTYNVYEVTTTPAAGAAAVPALPAPLNAVPLDRPLYQDGQVAFGVERCFVVRTVEAVGSVTLESAPSTPACVRPVDTFPPAAPRNLAAVAGEGAINLIWETNSETDLLGYLVLRGEAGSGTLTAVTAAPVKETTYRDTDVRPGVRYVYAVVAVDTATPQNVSVESNRVEETAR